MAADTLRVGITCYPSVGGSGVLATSLGEDLAARGHDVHFIAYERPFRLPSDAPRLHFHPVAINEYELFRFPDYTLPLSLRIAGVRRGHGLAPRPPGRPPDLVRRELGLGDEVLVVHSSNLRHGERVDLLLETVARVRPRGAFKLLILAGEAFAPFAGDVRRLGLTDRVIVREKVYAIEDYLQIADVGLYTSDAESFCLSILEAMCFGCPSVSTRVGGIPEVVEDNESALLVPAGDVAALAKALEALIHDEPRRHALGHAAQARARERFSAEVIVPRYEALYRRLCR